VNYRVIWDDAAVRALQRIYDAAHDKEGLVNTVERLGLQLSAAPFTAGESRSGNRRIHFKFPLIVWYSVDERMKEVVVAEVRVTRR
jgi:plasmid stabilization system protein ParE